MLPPCMYMGGLSLWLSRGRMACSCRVELESWTLRSIKQTNRPEARQIRHCSNITPTQFHFHAKANNSIVVSIQSIQFNSIPFEPLIPNPNPNPNPNPKPDPALGNRVYFIDFPLAANVGSVFPCA
ncbi:hypothetical protein IWZ00DRAFT_300981 [Phyllosticta capitalensis]